MATRTETREEFEARMLRESEAVDAGAYDDIRALDRDYLLSQMSGWTGVFGLDFTVQIRAENSAGGRLGQTLYHPTPHPPPDTVPRTAATSTTAASRIDRKPSSMTENQPHEDSPEPPVGPGSVLLGNGEQHAVAHLGRRLVARLLDFLILVLILRVLGVPIDDVVPTHVGWMREIQTGGWVHNPDDPLSALIYISVFLAIAFFYLVVLFYDMLFIAALGYTPGKRIMTIRIVRMEDGSKPRFWKGLTRALTHPHQPVRRYYGITTT